MTQREIKFRVWDGERMYTLDNHAFDLIYNDISGWNVAPNLPCEQLKGMKWTTGDSSDNADKFVMMQFTGLKDKNGKDIYEGDIVKMAEWNSPAEFRSDDSHHLPNIKLCTPIARFGSNPLFAARTVSIAFIFLFVLTVLSRPNSCGKLSLRGNLRSFRPSVSCCLYSRYNQLTPMMPKPV